MIVSHKYKFIFIKTTKTAGTSVEISLSRFCTRDDIVTPLMKKDELIRREMGLLPYNYCKPKDLAEYNVKDFLRLVLKRKKALSHDILYYNHMPASAIKEAIGNRIWDKYLKFCFVRNPWDRAISRYYWSLEQKKSQESLDENLKRHDPNSNFPIYTIDGKVAVDYVGKYENLLEDLSYVCQNIGLPFDNWLPKTKNESRQIKQHYSKLLTLEQAEYIKNKCAQEITLFNYSYSQ